MSIYLDNVNDYGIGSFSPVAAPPLTLNVWFKCYAVPANFGPLLFLYNSGNVNEVVAFFLDNSSRTVRSDIYDDTGAGDDREVSNNTVANYTVGAWQMATLILPDNAAGSSFLNGGNKHTFAKNIQPAGLDRIAFGLYGQYESYGVRGPIHIAEAAVWDRVLSDAEIQGLFAGKASAKFLPSGLRYYNPLWGSVYGPDWFRPKQPVDWSGMPTAGTANVYSSLDPNADGSTLEWTPSTGTSHYAVVDDAARQPTDPGTSDYLRSSHPGNTTGTKTEELGFATATLASGALTEVKVWVRAYAGGIGASSAKLDCQVYLGGAWQTAQNVFTGATSSAWFSVTFTGSWNQTDLDNLQVRLLHVKTSTSGVYPSTCDVYEVYVDVPTASDGNHHPQIVYPGGIRLSGDVYAPQITDVDLFANIAGATTVAVAESSWMECAASLVCAATLTASGGAGWNLACDVAAETVVTETHEVGPLLFLATPMQGETNVAAAGAVRSDITATMGGLTTVAADGSPAVFVAAAIACDTSVTANPDLWMHITVAAQSATVVIADGRVLRVFKHMDWECPDWGEFAAGPVSVGAGAVLTQSGTGAFPDRGGSSLVVTWTTGTGSSYLGHDIGEEQSLLHVRMLLAVASWAGGGATVLQVLDEAEGEVWRIAVIDHALTVTLAGGATLTATLPGQTWNCVEVAIATAGTATLWVNGVEIDSATGDFSALAGRHVRMGGCAKASDAVGVVRLDEVVLGNRYVGPVRLPPTMAHGGDPRRWLCLYNADIADAAAWAEHYREARGVPYANLVGLSLPAGEDCTATQMQDLRDTLSDYLQRHGLQDQIRGLLLGYGCPGTVDGGSALASWLMDLTAAAGDANPAYQSGVVMAADLPVRSTLTAGDRRLVGEITAADVTTAQAMSDDVLVATKPDGRDFAALDSVVDRLAAAASGWTSLSAWLGTLAQQDVRLPRESDWAGEHGHAIEFSDAAGGDFDVTAQRRVLLASVAAGSADVLRSGSDLVAQAVAEGYAAAIGYVGTPAGGDLFNPAALVAAFRAGWTLAEAWMVAAPKLACSGRVVGDPLARVLLPQQGYRVYGRATLQGAETLAAIAPAGVPSATVTGSAGSEAWYRVRAVSEAGIEDVAGPRLTRVRFDGAGALLALTPNAPSLLSVLRLSGGRLLATWIYSRVGEAVAPAQFKVYAAVNGAAFNFASANATVAAAGLRQYAVTLGPYSHGDVVAVIVRAAAASGATEDNLWSVSLAVDAAAPDAPAAVALEVTST